MKRSIDIIGAVLGIVVFSPLLILCTGLVALTSPGPILFSHHRIGYKGRTFGCLKFRTMLCDAQSILHEHLAADPNARAEWEACHKLTYDPRITVIGRALRKTSLDELPQLFNVLIGDMSMVGPRPIVAEEAIRYGDKFGYYLRARPGLTGLWQVTGRNTTTYAERVEYDVDYVKTWSVATDVKLILRTVPHLMGTDGAY